MKILFASGNKNKVKEIKLKLSDTNVEILDLNSIDFKGEIPETSDTIKGNAIQKAKYIHDKFNIDCFSDDTGLEIESLNNSPGVFSARYAGENCTSDDNIKKVLSEMDGKENRYARFITVISLILNDKNYTFEGIIEGEISKKESGVKGFGYDPIFKPKGYDITFAEMSIELKNKISHRALAVNKLIEFLKNKKNGL